MNKILTASTSVFASLLIAGSVFADNQRAMMKPADSESPSAIITRASNVYSSFTKSGQKVPQSVLDKAQCIAVIPQTVTAALVVGGTHGDGIASCRLSDNTWSSPAFVDLNAASIGAQAGAKETDVVLYFTSTRTANALRTGKIDFGADASVVAGNFERTFDVSNAGVVAYQANSGAFLGASIGGGTLSSSDQSNRAYYGKDVQVNQILNGTESTSAATRDAADALLRQFPS